MKRTACAVALMLAFACLVAPAAEAGEFSVRDVDGPTAFAFDGFVGPVGGSVAAMAPAAAVGRFVADGDGRLNDGVRTLVVAGAAVHQTFTCSYTVNPDGTGSASCMVRTGAVVT